MGTIQINSLGTDDVPGATQIPTNPTRANEEPTTAPEELLTLSGSESQAKQNSSSELLDILGSSPLTAQTSGSENLTINDDNSNTAITNTTIINLEETQELSDSLHPCQYSSIDLLEEKGRSANLAEQIPV